MRLAVWNCSGAFHRKAEAIAAWDPDVAVISECAEPERLVKRGLTAFDAETCLWTGTKPNKGLGVFVRRGYGLSLAPPHHRTLHHILPVRVTGPSQFHLLAVWAQNASGGVTRKHQLGPLRRALTKYRDFLADGPTFLGGDFNNNVYWDRPGWRMNHAKMVATASNLGLTSAYHHWAGEPQGGESIPTHYWRDRKKDGPTYHIDYIFGPAAAMGSMTDFRIGTFEDWCGNGLSDHVPLLIDLSL